MSIYCRNDGFLDGVWEIGPRFDEVVTVGVGEGFGRHLFDVSAGREGLV